METAIDIILQQINEKIDLLYSQKIHVTMKSEPEIAANLAFLKDRLKADLTDILLDGGAKSKQGDGIKFKFFQKLYYIEKWDYDNDREADYWQADESQCFFFEYLQIDFDGIKYYCHFEDGEVIAHPESVCFATLEEAKNEAQNRNKSL